MPNIFGKNQGMIAYEAASPTDTSGMISLSSGENDIFTFPIIIESFSSDITEKVQIVEAFNEVVHFFAYGKGVGKVSISGCVFSIDEKFLTNSLNTGLISQYEKKLRAFKVAKDGKLILISGPGGVVLKGAASHFTYNIHGRTNSMIQFNMTFLIVDSIMGI